MFKQVIIGNILLVSISLFSAESNCTAKDVSYSKEYLARYYESGQFEFECQSVVDNAIEYLQSNGKTLSAKKTVIFDIEDTVLLSFKYCQSINFCKHCYDLNYDSWVCNANWPTIQPIKEFYDFLIINDYKIIFLSDRLEDKTDHTLQNLSALGYSQFEQLILKPSSMKDMPSYQYKSFMRRKLADQGYLIVACVGDQDGDFEDGSFGYKIKIPNYISF